MASGEGLDGSSLIDVRDRNGNQIARLELDLADTTPADVLGHLKSEGRIADRDPQNGQQMMPWLAFNQRELVSDRQLASQGVAAGAVLSVEYRHVKGADAARLQRELELLMEMARRSEGRIAVEAEP